jgi:hypothetical protein
MGTRDERKIDRPFILRVAANSEAGVEVIRLRTSHLHHRLRSTVGHTSPIGFEGNWQAGPSRQAA